MELRKLSQEETSRIHEEAVLFASTNTIVRKNWELGNKNKSLPSTTAGVLKAASSIAKLAAFQYE